MQLSDVAFVGRQTAGAVPPGTPSRSDVICGGNRFLILSGGGTGEDIHGLWTSGGPFQTYKEKTTRHRTTDPEESEEDKQIY